MENLKRKIDELMCENAALREQKQDLEEQLTEANCELEELKSELLDREEELAWRPVKRHCARRHSTT